MNDGVVRDKIVRYPIVVLSLCWLFWLYIFVERVVVSSVLPSVEQEMGVSHAEAGLLLTSMMFTLALTSLPAGLLSSRLGAKRTVLLSAAIITLMSLLLSQTTSYAQFAVGLLVLGVGLGAFFPSCIAILAQWFPPSRLGRAIGIVETAPPFGYLLGVGVVVAVLVVGMGWRASYMALALPGLLMLAAFWMVVKERREADGVDEKGMKIRDILRMRRILLFILPFIFNAMYMNGAISLIPLYLVSTHGTDPVFANTMFIIINAFGIPGPIMAGWLSDRFGREPVLVALLAIMAVAAFAFVLLPLGWPLIALMALVNMLSCGYYPVAFTHVSENVPPAARAPMVGLFLSTGFFLSALAPFVIGFLGDLWNLNTGFLFPTVLLALGAVYVLVLMRRAARFKPVCGSG